MERLTTREKYPHGAEGRSKDKLTGKFCRGVFEATAVIEKLAEYEDDEESGRILREKQVNALVQYIFNNLHWCPFKDEAKIDYEKECVGFGEKECKECILKNIEQLN